MNSSIERQVRTPRGVFAAAVLAVVLLCAVSVFSQQESGATPAEPTESQATVSAACREVERQIAAARKELDSVRTLILQERTVLHEEMLETEEKLRDVEQAVSWLESEKSDLEDTLYEVSVKNRNKEQELLRICDILEENRKEFQAFVNRIDPREKQFDALDDLFLSENVVDNEEKIRTLLFELYGFYLDNVSRVTKLTRRVILPDGSSETGELVRCGVFGGAFWGRRGTLGIAYLPPNAHDYHVVSGPGAESMEQPLNDLFFGKGETASIPCDVSEGKAIARLGETRTFYEFLKAGGVVIIPIAVIAFLSMLMLIERVVVLAQMDTRIDRLLDRILPMVKAGDFDAAHTTAEAADGPVGRILLAGIDGAREETARIDDVLEDAMLRELPRLERFTSTVGVFAAIVPLLGLLGTVSGMIRTFQVIKVYGTGDSRLLSGGISEALITTEVGLAVAVPLLLAHAWLSRRVKTVLGHMDRAAISFTGMVRGDTREDHDS